MGQYLWQICSHFTWNYCIWNCIFCTLWRLWKLVFWQKTFQDLISIFSFYPKNSGTGFRKSSITQALLVVESCPTPHRVTLLIFRRLFYDLPCHLNGLILAWRTSLQLCLKGNVWNVPISETGSRCNSVFRHNDSNWVIIMELERKVEYSWTYTFWASLCFKRYRSLPWTWDGVSIRFQLQLMWRVRRFFIFFYIFNMSLFKT